MRFKQHKNYQKFVVNISLLISSIIWGSTFFIQKDALSFVGPMAINFYRALLGALILGLGLILFKKNPFHNFRTGIITGILYCLGLTTQMLGLQYTSAFNSGFITGLFVLFVPIFSFFLWRTKLSIEKIIAVLLSMFGLWFSTGGMHGFNFGDFLNLLSAVFWGFYVLAADKSLKNGSDPYLLNFQQLFITGILSAIIMLIFHLSYAIHALHAVYIIVYLAVFANVVAYCLQFIAQKHASPVNIAMLLLLEPVFAGIFAWTLGGENFTWLKCLGGIIIVAAIALSEAKLTDFKKNFIYMFSKNRI